MNIHIKETPLYKWEVLVLLWVAFFLNQAVRQVFNVVLPLIKVDFQLSDLQVGLIATIFNLVYALLVPLAGYAGDLYNRKWIVVLSILLWSIATMLTGFSNSVLMLILLRSIATGGGEAFFGPANYSLLAKYHKETRSFAMSVHQTAFYLGIIVSGSLAGYIGEQFGWRYAFYIFGIAGVIHGLLMIFRLEDKDRHKEDRNKLRFLEVTKILFHTPTALIITIALCGQIFVLTGYLTWIPTYLYENFNMSLSQAGFHSLFYTHIFAFFGIIIAGMYSDKLALKDPAKRLLIQGAGLLVAAPFIILMGNSNVLITIYIGFAGFGFFRGCYDANIWACLYDVIPQKYYSSASGIILMFGFSVGSLAPLILGYLKPSLGLSLGISLLSIVWFVCGLLLLVAYKYYFRKDYMRIHQ